MPKFKILLKDANGNYIKAISMELTVDNYSVIDYNEPKCVSEHDRIDHILYKMGILHLNNGFFYLKHAVRLCLENKSYFSCVTKSLYPEIAKMYGTTAIAIERAIRNLIKICWEEHEAGTFYIKTTGMPSSMLCTKPTSSAYIQLLVEIYEKQYGVNSYSK